MNGAIFFLAVNFVVAVCFSAVFALVATSSRSRTAAIWLAAGFGIASLSALCELMVAFGGLPKLFGMGAFTSVLAGMVLLRIGIGELYGQPIDRRLALAFGVASVIWSYFIYDLPRGTLLHAFSYQTPFAIAVFASALAVLRSNGRLMADRFLGLLLLVTGLHFFAKAALAVAVGAGSTAKDYIHTNYALISQSATAVLIVAVGLMLMAVLVLEIMADRRSESEQDALSGIANRRGFERKVQALLAQAPYGRHAVILCDLDHFKRVNDIYGHHVGDLVIRAFGQLLERCAPNGAAIGRIGGEEFAIFLPATDIDVAILFAQALRSATMNLTDLPDNIRVTASFGISMMSSADELPEAYRRADVALYDAKNAGRNRVRDAGSSDRIRPAKIHRVEQRARCS